MYYKRFTDGLNDRGTLIPAEADIFDYVKDTNKDYYLSTYLYNEEQRKLFQETGSIAGITDVVTNKLWWDFDSEFEPEAARKSAISLTEKLLKEGIEEEDIQVTFSGNKGYGVEVNLTSNISPRQAKDLAFNLAKDLPHFDVKMYNAARILRIFNTKHQKTGLYKIPLVHNQLLSLSNDEIIKLAKEKASYKDSFKWKPVDIKVNNSSPVEEKSELFTTEINTTLDYSLKPKFLSNCRWAVQNGHFREGDRSTALLCLGSTYKNLGFDLEHVYRLLKGTAELQARITKSDRFSDEEIYNNIVMQVFGPHWNNGQYTCREKGNWLNSFCSKLDHPCNHKEEDELKPKKFTDLTEEFKTYVKNIEKNTIYTGLPTLDKHVFLSTGANVVIVAAAGAGKTSVGLEILEHTSRAGVKSVCASLDMAKNRIYEKIMYRISGLPRDNLYKLFKEDGESVLVSQLTERFGNVNFFKKSCPTVNELKEYIINCNEHNGEKTKLVLVDYFERLTTDIGDETAASKRIAGELQDLVDELDICLITLYQPNKFALSGGPDSAIYDYTKIKGSSFLYQAPRIILSCWRPFYNPKDFSKDKYMQMAVLKNDLGELAEMAFNWEGKRGVISEFEDFQRDEFEELLREKIQAKEQNGSIF